MEAVNRQLVTKYSVSHHSIVRGPEDKNIYYTNSSRFVLPSATQKHHVIICMDCHNHDVDDETWMDQVCESLHMHGHMLEVKLARMWVLKKRVKVQEANSLRNCFGKRKVTKVSWK